MSGALRGVVNRRNIARLLLWMCWLGLTIALSVNAACIGGLYPALSLRYHAPITAASADSARRYAEQNPESAAYWPTFWAESEEEIRASFSTIQSACLWYSGDGALVWPARFVGGGWPGALAEGSVCVSMALAWQLWGSGDVLGLEVDVADASYTVGGVFAHDKPLAIISMGSATPLQGWQAVQLAGNVAENRRAAAINFSTAAGLGMPDTLLDGPAIGDAALFMAGLPSVGLLIFYIVRLFRWAWRRAKNKRGLVLMGGALLFAAALPGLLALLPQEAIPSRWSDFAFWGRLLETQTGIMEEWFAMRPLLVDIQAKWRLVTQTGQCFILIIISFLLCLGTSVPASKRKSKILNLL